MSDPKEHRAVRDADEHSVLAAVPTGLFAAWRRMIGMLARVPRHVGRIATCAGRSWIGQWRTTLEYHRHADEAWDADDLAAYQPAAALGARAFVFGMIVLALVTASGHNAWGPGVMLVASEVLWTGMRFIIIALLMPRAAIGRTRLTIAFLAGLLPYALAATWLLRLAALAASAVLTYRGLLGAGVARRDVRLATGWAFGGQMAVFAGGWLIRGVIAVLTLG